MLSADKELAYDVETNGLRWQTMFICGYSLSDGVDAYYVPVRHEPGGNIEDVYAFESAVAQIIKKRTKALIMHNGKFDMHFSQNHGIYLGKKVKDTMINGAILDEWQRSYSLENLCKQHPDIPQKKGSEIKKYICEKFGCDYKSAMGHFWRLAGDDPMAIEYAAGDTLATYCLYKKQEMQLYAQEFDVLMGMENELIYVLQKMERKGIRIDMDRLPELTKEIEDLQVEAYKDIPLDEDLNILNPKSGKDIQKYLEYLNIQDWPVTDKGNPSFTKTYLQTKDEADCILTARKLDTFMNMFLTPLPSYIHNERVHTNFNQTAGEFGGTKTGRLSCFGPNMQQIPKRDKFIGKKFRKCFIADPDFVLIELDYSQIEPRLFTHYSGEPILVDGYSQVPAIDMHSIACTYMDLYKDYTDDEEGRDSARSKAKNLNLGMQYVMGTTKLAVQLGITLEDAKIIVSKWRKTFKNVSKFTRSASERVEQRGYVKTILGRRARFNDLRFAYRAANRIVQGGAADIIKWKIVELNRWIENNDLDDQIQMLLTIHDSIVLQIRKDSLHFIKDIQAILERLQVPPFNTKVPFTVDFKPPSENWSEASYGPLKK